MQTLETSSKSPLMLLILLGVMVIATLIVISSYFLRPGIELDFKHRITEDLHRQGLPYTFVNIRDGDVTLRGYVANQYEALKAEEMVQGTLGIHQVNNELLIKN